jgi:hypothetical protein
MYLLCIDFSLSLEERLTNVDKLTDIEKDSLLEHLCSAYMINPLFIYEQYLQYLILRSDLSLSRRIRIGELCDLGLTVLYLLTRMSTYERIRCIELFSNPYLKIHAYNVLFPHVDIAIQIQILKNMYSLPRVNTAKILDKWMLCLSDDSLEYKIRSNCADAILNHSKDSYQIKTAKNFLGILNHLRSIYDNRENVHLFLPNMKVLEKILENSQSTPLEEIVEFIEKRGYHTELFWNRIINDKTRFGKGTTLEELICKIWSQLTPDLKSILVEDIYSSEEHDEQWMCTTGYYNRIINVYQTMITDQTLFDHQKEFNYVLNQRVNYYLSYSEEKDDILLELPQKGEEKRIRFLTFKVQALPLIIDELREKFPSLTTEEFDEYFSNGLRDYEDTLD